MLFSQIQQVISSFFCITFLFASHSYAIKADITVASDGSGDYKKVQDAVKAAKSGMVIFIRPGVYKEQVHVTLDKIKFIGESYKTTIITCDKDADDGRKTHATVIITGDDFYAENITFQNTVDSRVKGKQAEAIRLTGDRAIFYMCNITGFQDTYYTGENRRSYHKNCIIDGTTDFIYGNGIMLFEDCTIRNRKNSHITAASHAVGKHKYGFVFKNCKIIVYPNEKVNNASLGRPWNAGARVVYLTCDIGKHIRSAGFAPWSTDPKHKYYSNIKTAFFAVYKCKGQPSNLLSDAHVLSDSEAAQYTAKNIFAANSTSATKLSGDWYPVIKNATDIMDSGQKIIRSVQFRIASNNTGLFLMVSYKILKPSQVKLIMYDLYGREVAVLQNSMVSKGSHTLNIEQLNLPNGLYIPRFFINDGNNRQMTVHTLKQLCLK